ncbi:head maturation protease, ClpP-related [Luteibacter sp. 621]|uniref:head maturation protease, ClpP-related n=1 Tax=Luteibacter sp. 621 TaxID=3373916 RepID=UPI003D2247D3
MATEADCRRAFDGEVNVSVLGLAASAASIIAMAGDTVQIARAGFFMIHNAWVVASGNRNDLREYADTLEPFDRAMADIYAAHTGESRDDMAKLMDAETWIGGSDAVEQGFAESLLASDQVEKGSAKANASAVRRIESALRASGLPKSEAIATTNSIQARIPAGTWIVRARAVGRLGLPGPWNQNPVDVSGAPPVLGELTNFVATPMVMAILLTWQMPDRLNLIGADAVEIFFGTTPTRAQAAPLATVALPANSYSLLNLRAGDEFYFWARVRGTDTGNYGPEIGPIHGESSSDAAQILDYLTGKISSTQLAQDLLSKFDAIDDLQAFIQAPEWEAAKAYAIATIVAHGERLYRAVQAIPLNGPEPGTDATMWRDIGARVQTAYGLVGSIYDTNLQVQDLGDAVQATASRTDAIYAQVNPKGAGEYTGDGDDAADWETLPTAGYYSYTLAQVYGDRAQASRTDTLSAQVSSVTGTVSSYQASIQLISNAQASLDGKVSASYTIKTEIAANGQRYLAGIAVGVDYSGGTVTSQVLVNAATFAVFDASNGGAAARFPFVITGGQVFVDSAFIANASITTAKIAYLRSAATDSNGNPLWEIDPNGALIQRGSGSGFRTERDGAGARLYDGNGTLRFRWGAW